MVGKSKINVLTQVLSIISLCLLGLISIIFSILYLNLFESGLVLQHKTLFKCVIVGGITVLTVLTVVFYSTSKKMVYKLFFITIVTIAITFLGLYLLKSSGFLDKIDSVEDFRDYIKGFGGFAVLIFIILQILQVVVLPIPSFITVGAGVLLFGPFYGSIYSVIGIIVGSVLAYFIGKVFGYKVAKWLVGKDSLDKALKNIKGKDKIVLTFMFLFPFFPDDILCFVCGITTMTPLYFLVMIFITRIITVFASSYSMNNSIIPYDTWWGILLWIVFFAITIVLTILIYRHGERIERFILKNRKNNSKYKAK